MVRSCDSAVFGQPNMRHAISIGPLTLVGTDQSLSPSMFEPHHDRYEAIKVLALVMGSRDVTVTVPLSERDSVFLLYDPDARGDRNGFPVSEADAQVGFEACPGTEPQYNGGLLATDPGCIDLDIVIEGSRLVSGSFPLGVRGSCSTQHG